MQGQPKAESVVTPFKEMFNRETVQWTADRMQAAFPSFPKESFIARVMERLPQLELKARSSWITDCLHKCLPADYPSALHILLNALEPDPGPPEREELGSFRYMPLGSYISRFGLSDFDRSILALKEITKRFSMEFDIRHFLEKYPTTSLEKLIQWAQDSDWRVRRLASEGSRPRLPWGMRLNLFVENPKPVLRILEHLQNDPHSAVRRSVANNLNDISKDHPKLVIETLSRWIAQSGSHLDYVTAIARHALRGLVKAGDPAALQLLGFHPEAKIEVLFIRSVQKTVRIGESLEIQLALKNQGPTSVRLSIDYAVHYVKANGKLRPKVFKLAQREIEAGQTLELTRRHSFRPVTTRTYYAGSHQLELLVNGARLGHIIFDLEQGGG